MKVLDLQCALAHSFEGWFGSEDDFQSQLARGLVECPLCGNASITKKLSAPRLNLSGARNPDKPSNGREERSADASADPTDGSDNAASRALATVPAKPMDASQALMAMAQDPQLQAAYMQMARKIMAHTEDVGNQFASEARKIHYGEADERAIRGQATRDETLALLDEGIDVLPLPLPEALKHPLQ
jgi:hypothetical protein